MDKRLAHFWQNQLLFLTVAHDCLSEMPKEDVIELAESGDLEDIIDAYYLSNYSKYALTSVLKTVCLEDLATIRGFPLYNFYFVGPNESYRESRIDSIESLNFVIQNEPITKIMNTPILDAFIVEPWGVHLVLKDVSDADICAFLVELPELGLSRFDNHMEL